VCFRGLPLLVWLAYRAHGVVEVLSEGLGAGRRGARPVPVQHVVLALIITLPSTDQAHQASRPDVPHELTNRGQGDQKALEFLSYQGDGALALPHPEGVLLVEHLQRLRQPALVCRSAGLGQLKAP
jgi:hypothetical protein